MGHKWCNLKSIQEIVLTSNSSILNCKLKYQYQASMIKLCIDNSKPCLIYGDIGLGKTSLIEVITEFCWPISVINRLTPLI